MMLKFLSNRYLIHIKIYHREHALLFEVDWVVFVRYEVLVGVGVVVFALLFSTVAVAVAFAVV